MQKMVLLYVASVHFDLSLYLSLFILGSSCPGDRTEHLLGGYHCSYGGYGCWWGSGKHPMGQTAVCPGFARYGVRLSEQVLGMTEAPLKLSSMCRWFLEWKRGLKGTHWWIKLCGTKWKDIENLSISIHLSVYLSICLSVCL